MKLILGQNYKFMYKNKFFYISEYTKFVETQSSIPNDAIVFIKDVNAIWTHGKFFYCHEKDMTDQLSDYVTHEELEKVKETITKPLNYKGSVDTVSDLPDNPKVGDVWNVKDTDMNYVWTDDKGWDQFGSNHIDVVDNLTDGGTSVALSAEQGKILNEKIETKQDKGNYLTYIDANGRKVVQLNNNDIIGAVANEEPLPDKQEASGWVSLIHLNKWNVVDIGSDKVLANINTPKNVRPTIQEAGQSGPDAHKMAYLDDIEDLDGKILNINNTLTWIEL